MSDVKTISDESRGPLGSIQDETARREIGKLWSVVEGRVPATGKSAQPHTLATHADLTRVEASLSKRIESIQAPSKQVVMGGGQQSGGGGLDLRPSNNIWTGTNQFQRAVTVYRMDAGALYVNETAPIVLSAASFTAALDVQRTSNVATHGTGLGGTAALYVQHRAEGAQPAGKNVLTTGMRCQLETRQQGTGSNVCDAVSGYFGLLNGGKDTGGFGLHVDAYHVATGSVSTTYGVSVEMYGSGNSLVGKTVGVLVRSAGTGAYTRPTNYGVLVSPDSVPTNAVVDYAFAAGSDWVGPLKCKVAFDASHAQPAEAAVRLRAGDGIVYDGPTANQWKTVVWDNQWLVMYGPAYSLRVTSGGAVVSRSDVVIESGTLAIDNPSDLGPIHNLGGATTGFRHWGYVAMRLGKTVRYVPFFGE